MDWKGVPNQKSEIDITLLYDGCFISGNRKERSYVPMSRREAELIAYWSDYKKPMTIRILLKCRCMSGSLEDVLQ